ncbi:MAG: tetratricopeptide repeat protein [Candidatus Omnitrophota bacterium]
MSTFLKRILLIVVISLGFSSLGICDISSDFNREGLRALGEGRYREAIVYLESAHKADPENAIIIKNLSYAYHSYASAYASEKDWEQAISNQEQALKYSPKDKVLNEQMGVLYNNYALECSDNGKYDKAVDLIKKGLERTPDAERINSNLYNVLLQQADYLVKKQVLLKALRISKEAIEIFPEKYEAYEMVGELYYQMDNFAKARTYLKKALDRNPDNSRLISRMEKLEKESVVEEEFKTKQRAYFKIRFEKETGYQYAGKVSSILEEARRRLGRDFGFYPKGIIPVIIYKGERFDQATGAADWTLGLYDGKIRLREQDTSKEDSELRRILYHEYSHAALFLIYGVDIPLWFHEGFAQYNEPSNDLSSAEKDFLKRFLDNNNIHTLEGLESIFAEKPGRDSLTIAYIESKLAVRYIVKKYKKNSCKRFLECLKDNNDWVQCVREVYHRVPDRLNDEIAKYVKQQIAEE